MDDSNGTQDLLSLKFVDLSLDIIVNVIAAVRKFGNTSMTCSIFHKSLPSIVSKRFSEIDEVTKQSFFITFKIQQGQDMLDGVVF